MKSKTCTIVMLLAVLSSSFRALAQPSPVSCSNRASCSAHGECVNKQCVCDGGYATMKDNEPCGYEQKKQFAAFMLSFFLGPFGADRFFIGQPGLGVGKLALTLVTGPAGMLACHLGQYSDGFYGLIRTTQIGRGIGICGGAAIFSWWLADIVMFGTNSAKDGNGIPLQPW